jgi:hypothetical protein
MNTSTSPTKSKDIVTTPEKKDVHVVEESKKSDDSKEPIVNGHVNSDAEKEFDANVSYSS